MFASIAMNGLKQTTFKECQHEKNLHNYSICNKICIDCKTVANCCANNIIFQRPTKHGLNIQPGPFIKWS